MRTLQGVSITYHLDTTSSVVIESAVRTKPRTDQRNTGEETIIESRHWDWLIDPDGLYLENQRIIPAIGHFIVTGTDRFNLRPRGSSEDCWRYSDGFKTFVRIYCEEVDA